MRFLSFPFRVACLFALCVCLSGCGSASSPVVTGSWETKTGPSVARSGGSTAAVIDGKLYLVGGVGPDAGTSLEIYDPAADAWNSGAALPERRESPVTVALDGKLYVIGGTNPGAADAGGDYHNAQVATVYVYDPAKDSWTTTASLHERRDVAAGVVVDGKIYMLGGMVGTDDPKKVNNLDSVEVYDPSTSAWTLLSAKMPTPTRAMGYAAVGKKIYLFGGCAGLSSSPCTQTRVQVFDTESQEWTALPESANMPTGRHFSGQGAQAVGTDIYVFGGATDFSKRVFGAVEIFDTKTETWRTGPTMKTPRKSGASAVLDGYLYVIGGHTDDTYKLGNSTNERLRVAN